MKNISFKGFYKVEPLGNKKVNMKLVSEMVKTIPGSETMESTGYNTKTFFVPEQQEIEFEKLAEALRAKSLAHIKTVSTKKPSLDTLLKIKIRDFSPSNEYTYVALDAEELKNFTENQKIIGYEENTYYDTFHLGLLNSKINIPEISVINTDKSSKYKSNLGIQIPNASKKTISSFLKLGYKEIPVKLTKNDLKRLEKQSTKLNQNVITRHINVLPLENRN